MVAAAWLSLALAAVYLLWTGIGHESLGFDEAYSLAAVGWDIPQMIPMIGKDSHPPLYFMQLNLWVRLFGHSPEAARSLSALGALALAALGFFPLRQWWGERRGLLYSLSCLATPMVVIMGQDARMYTWGAFFAAASFLAAWDVRQKLGPDPGQPGAQHRHRRTWPSWLALALASVAAAYTHYYALLAAFAAWFLLLAWLGVRSIRRRLPGRHLLAFGLWAGLAVLAWLPWAGYVARQAGRISLNYWIPAPDAGTVVDMLCMPWNFKYGMAFPSFLLMPLAWALVLGGAAALAGRFWRLRQDRQQPEPADRSAWFRLEFALWGCGSFLLVLAIALGVSLAFRPVLVQRYMVCALGPLLMGLAWGLDRLFHPGQPRGRAWGILGVFLVCGGLILNQVHTTRFSGAMTEAVEFVSPRLGPDDVFIHASEHTLGTFAWYFPDHKHYFYLPAGTVPYSNYEVFLKNSRWGSELGPYLASDWPGARHQQIWFAFVEFQDYFRALKPILDSPDWTFSTKLKTFYAGSSWYQPCLIGFRRLQPGEAKLTDAQAELLD